MSKHAPQPKPITGQPFRDDDPAFTVIVTDYESSVTRDHFRRKMACLAEQTCKDFEVLVYHDGPKSSSYAEDLAGGPMHPSTQFIVTPAWIGDWGHSARDLGIRAARGRWIIHTNADNVFYPTLIAVLKDVLTDPQRWVFAQRRSKSSSGLRLLDRWLDKTLDPRSKRGVQLSVDDPQILVYGIIMRGELAMQAGKIRVTEVADRQGVILGGVPVKYYGTDAMQLVMLRALWLAEGGWHDRRMDSDGFMYPQFAKKYRVLSVPAILGEHW